MTVHSSALCSAVTAHGIFTTHSGKFLSRPRVSQTTKWHNQSFAAVSHSVTNWHRPLSCADSTEINLIHRAIDDYHNKTSIRFKQFEPAKDKNYIHITGEEEGCTSNVGRQGGVSSRVQGVVKTSPELRNSPLGIHGFICQKTISHRFITWYNHLWAMKESSCPNCSESLLNQLEVHQWPTQIF